MQDDIKITVRLEVARMMFASQAYGHLQLDVLQEYIERMSDCILGVDKKRNDVVLSDHSSEKGSPKSKPEKAG